VLTMQPVLLYPYLQIETIAWLTREKIQSLLATIWQTIQARFRSDMWIIRFGELPTIDLKQLSLTILRDDVSYEQLPSLLDSNVLEWVRDIKIKKDAVAMQDLLSDFSIQQDNLQTGFADWKAILKAYIQKKYPDNTETYMQLLQDMQLL